MDVRNALTISAVAVVVTIAMLLAPVTLAQDEDETPPENPFGAFLYLKSGGMTRDAPAEGATVQKRDFVPRFSGVDIISTPAYNYPMDWESYRFASDYVPSGDLVVNVFVTTSAQKATFHYASFAVLKGTSSIAEGTHRFLQPVTLDQGQFLELRSGITLAAGTVFQKGDTLSLRIYIAATVHVPTVAGPQIAYGSPSTPSGIYVPGSGSPSDVGAIRHERFLVEVGGTFSPALAAEASVQTKILPGMKPDTYTMVSIASAKVDEAMVASTDASCQLHLTYPSAQTAQVAPNRGVKCEILVGGIVKGSHAHECAAQACVVVINGVNGNVGPGVQSLRLGIPFKGVEIPAGAEIEMRVGVLAPEVPGQIEIQLLYGTPTRATGVQFGRAYEAPGADEGSIRLSADKASAEAAPGAAATYRVSIANEGPAAATVELGLDGIEGSFEGGAEVLVEAGESTSVSLTVTAPPDAEPGTIDFLVLAAVDDLPVADLPLTLVVSESGPAPTSQTTSGGEGGGGETGEPKDEGSKGTPGPAVGLVAAALAGASLLVRRRRRA